MNRRDVLRRGLAGLAAASFAYPAAATSSGLGCYEGTVGELRCQVGFPDAPEIEVQTCRTACWASCLAYMMRGYGAEVSADTILARLDPGGSCAVRDDARLLRRATGRWLDDAGRRFIVTAERLSAIRPDAFTRRDLEPVLAALRRRPLIVGQPGHSMILTEVAFSDAPMTRMRYQRLTLRDPWSGTPNLRQIERADMPADMFAIDLQIQAF